MMDASGNLTIALTEPLVVAGETITAIALRPPTLSELEEFGDAVEFFQREHVAGAVPNYPRLGEYIHRCAVAPPGAPAQWLDPLCMADTLRILDAMVRLWGSSKKAAQSIPGLPENQKRGI